MDSKLIPFKLTTKYDPKLDILELHENPEGICAGGINSTKVDRVYFDHVFDVGDPSLSYTSVYEVIYDRATKTVISIIEVDTTKDQHNSRKNTFLSLYESLSKNQNLIPEEKVKLLKFGINIISNMNHFAYDNSIKQESIKTFYKATREAFNKVINDYESIVKEVFITEYTKGSFELDATVYSEKMLGSEMFRKLKKEFEGRLRGDSTDDTLSEDENTIN